MRILRKQVCWNVLSQVIRSLYQIQMYLRHVLSMCNMQQWNQLFGIKYSGYIKKKLSCL